MWKSMLSYFGYDRIVDLLQKLAAEIAKVAGVLLLVVPDVSKVMVAITGFVVYNAYC